MSTMAEIAAEIPDGHVLAGIVTVCQRAGTYGIQVEGGHTHGVGDREAASEAVRRHSLVPGEWITRDIRTAGEITHTAYLYALDWSRCPA